MASKNSTVRNLKPQPAPQLTHEEVKRIAEKLAVALEHDAEEISLVTILFDHLETVAKSPADLWSAIYDIKKYLFISTAASEQAQKRFQANAYANRGKLLLWPYERGQS